MPESTARSIGDEGRSRSPAAAPRLEPFLDPAMARVAERLEEGRRLDFDDGLAIFQTRDLAALGTLADRFKTRLWGDQVFFVFNRQINPTNVCLLRCRFCDYAVGRSDPNAFAMTIDEILRQITPDLHEVHITGALHPDWPFARYVEIVRSIRQAYPKLQIKAYTAVEIEFFSRLSGLSIEAVLGTLREAGLDALPGGGAEVFSERVRAQLFPRKIGEKEWLDVHRAAHGLGIPSNATMLYGHIETTEERVTHLLKLRRLQDEAPGFLAFVSLAFQVGRTGITTRPPSSMVDLKMVAAARLLLDNVPHIKAYWVMLGEATASVALNFGADDMDGTIQEERIAHAAQAASPLGLARDRLIGLIRDAGKLPVERDALYNVIKQYPPPADTSEQAPGPEGKGWTR
jgi:aminodeoxyfutalosine synthase